MCFNPLSDPGTLVMRPAGNDNKGAMKLRVDFKKKHTGDFFFLYSSWCWKKGGYDKKKENLTMPGVFCLHSGWYSAEEGELHRLRTASEPVPDKLCLRTSRSQSADLQGEEVLIYIRSQLSGGAFQLFLTLVRFPPPVVLQVLHKRWHQQRFWRDGWAVQVRFTAAVVAVVIMSHRL